MVKQVAEMKIATGIRILRDHLYPVQVGNIYRQAVLYKIRAIPPGAAESLGQERDRGCENVVTKLEERSQGVWFPGLVCAETER